MRQADWYFDVISPYAYFQFLQLDRLPADLDVTLRPILFAGLLGHWKHKGPAEIPAKRVHTYRWCHWFAARNGIPFRMPPAHPFNPLKPLRLATAMAADRKIVRGLFDAVWAEGLDLSNDDAWAATTKKLGVPDADSLIADQTVKDTLRQTTEEAAARGVFGVPTFAIDDEIFWGVDSTDLVLDYLADPAAFKSGEFARIADLPIAQARKV